MTILAIVLKEYGSIEIIKVLRDAGADFNASDEVSCW